VREQDVVQEARDGESERHHDLHTVREQALVYVMYVMYVMCECVMRGCCDVCCVVGDEGV
jgi:hypothetical protein